MMRDSDAREGVAVMVERLGVTVAMLARRVSVAYITHRWHHSCSVSPYHYKKVKFSHTRNRAVGPEWIHVYRQSARKWLFKSPPAVNCHYFPTTFRAKECHPSTSIKLYCFVTEAHRCEQLAQGCYAALSWSHIQYLTATPPCHVPLYHSIKFQNFPRKKSSIKLAVVQVQ